MFASAHLDVRVCVCVSVCMGVVSMWHLGVYGAACRWWTNLFFFGGMLSNAAEPLKFGGCVLCVCRVWGQ